MDPITGAIVAAVLWFLLRDLLAVAGGAIVFGIFAGLAILTDQEWLTVVGIVLGWIAAIVIGIWSVIQGVIAIVEIVQLVTA